MLYAQIKWVVDAVEETADVNAVISVCIEPPVIDFSFFDDVFDAAFKEAQSICGCSKLLTMVSFACFFSIKISDNLL